MNRMLKKRLELIEGRLGELADLLQGNREEAVRRQEEKEELVKDQWTYRKEVATLNWIAEDYDRLEKEKRLMETQREDLRERLRRILNYTKVLSSAHRS